MSTARLPAAPEPSGSSRVLLLAPTGRDASITSDLLGRAGFECRIFETPADLANGIDDGAGLVIMTAEALTAEGMRHIARALEQQPPWSEIPLLILVPGPQMDRATHSFNGLGPRASVTLIDRPIQVRTLVSAVRAQMRTRRRQFEMRDLLQRLEEQIKEREQLLAREREHAARLSGLTEASLAIASARSLDEVLQLITDHARTVVDANVAVTSIASQVDGKPPARSVSCRPGFENRKEGLEHSANDLLDRFGSTLQRVARLGGNPAESLGGVFDGKALEGTIVAPLVEREGHSVGVIAAAGKSGGFTEEDEAAMTQLAQMASAAVQNARLFREAQDANRAKDDFLATLAHELRTPMTGILGWVQMLKMDGADKKDVRTAVQMIESSTRVQARLVEDLLDVSRIIAGKLRIELRAVELGPVIEDVVETFRTRAEENKLKLDASVADMPLSVYGDETRLHQIIWNLLSNAIKFTPAGGTVRVSLERQQSSAIVRVTDTGKGVDPEFLPYVFERFRQADNTTTRQQSGLGLGLAIVQHLVDLHHGSVTVTSEGEDRGTTFTVTLPVLAVRVEPEELPNLRAQTGTATLENISVLVVDDDPEAGHLVARVLEELGAQTATVTSVAEAIRTLRHFRADVIVSDIAMPGEDGYALMRRLRAIEPELGREVHAMALTGYGRPEDRTRILSAGFQQYIQKPVEPLELADAIAGLVH